MSTFDTPTSQLTQYDRPLNKPVMQGPRPVQHPSPGRAWVQQCMSDRAADLRKKVG